MDCSQNKPALPNGSTNPKKLPIDIFPFEETRIPRAFLPESMKELDDIEIVLGEIYSPSTFWFVLGDTYAQFESLRSKMKSFYKKRHAKYLIPSDVIRPGWYCVIIFLGEYLRALILDTHLHHDDKIRLYCIDYGNTRVVPSKRVYFLTKNFAQLPAQAISGRLATICPVRSGYLWPKEATSRFEELAWNRDLKAKVSRIYISEHDRYVELYVVDVTSTENIFYLNDKLVDEGLAKYTDEETLEAPEEVQRDCYAIVKQLHLHPTFLELEFGLVPNPVEMETLHKKGIPINFIIPHYFKDHMQSKEEAAELSKLIKLYEENCNNLQSDHSYNINQLRQGNNIVNLSVFGESANEIRVFMQQTEKYRALEEETCPR